MPPVAVSRCEVKEEVAVASFLVDNLLILRCTQHLHTHHAEKSDG